MELQISKNVIEESVPNGEVVSGVVANRWCVTKNTGCDETGENEWIRYRVTESRKKEMFLE